LFATHGIKRLCTKSIKGPSKMYKEKERKNRKALLVVRNSWNKKPLYEKHKRTKKKVQREREKE